MNMAVDFQQVTLKLTAMVGHKRRKENKQKH